MEEFACLNGSMVPIEAAKISIRDYGFLFGYGVFETMRAYRGAIFRLEGHLSRLADTAENLGFVVQCDAMKAAVVETVRVNGLQDARVRLSVSIGEGTPAPDPKSCHGPTILVTASQYVPYPAETYARGFRAIIASIRRNSQSPVPRMKTANYLENLLARQEARTHGADEALLLNDKGEVAEASASNVFIIRSGILQTPLPDSGILPGITRAAMLELASQLGIQAIEGSVSLDALGSADEAFLTNSLMGVMPLSELDGRVIGSGNAGAVTRILMHAYAALAFP